MKLKNLTYEDKKKLMLKSILIFLILLVVKSLVHSIPVLVGILKVVEVVLSIFVFYIIFSKDKKTNSGKDKDNNN